MKNIIFVLLIFINVANLLAQDSKFGVTAGLNYPWQENNGELTGASSSFFPSPLFGYQLGGFYERKYSRFIIRPQIMYYLSRGDYDFPNSSPIYRLKKLNFELLFGYEFINNVAIMAGPAYQNIIRNDFDVRGEDMSDNMRKANLLFGFKVQFSKRFEVSLMYDWTFDSDGNNRPSLPYDGSNVSFNMDDARMNILTLSIHYAIFTKKGKQRARSGSRGCYF